MILPDVAQLLIYGQRGVCMRVDVIVMAEKNTQLVMSWTLRPNRKGELRAVCHNGSSQSPEKSWKDLALKINRRALRGNHAPVEIFLYLRDGLRSSIYDYGILEDIVLSALEHAWAGKLYVVWDRLPATALEAGFGEEQEQILLAKCFCAFLCGRVTDLIELNHREKPRGRLTCEEERQLLRGCAAKSQRRWEILQGVASEGGWGYIARKNARILGSFLSELVSEGCLLSSGTNHVIILDAAPEFGPKELLDEFRRVNRVNNGIVAATPEGYSKDLCYQCRGESPLLEVLTFNGVFEVVYALLQLNTVRKVETRQEHLKADTQVEIKDVKLIRSPVFHPPAAQSSPRLLITSAFHPNEEPEHSIAAAHEVGAMLRGLPFHLDVVVHPCITCESLPNLLESGEFTAWIHLSHGEKEEGLYEPQLKEYASPQRWLTCFTAYKSSLKLAVFSSCESACVARLFAEAGVSVAVGFESVVLVQATRLLAQKVIRAAMLDGSGQESILEAFRDACDSLAARTYAEGGNDVSYNAARPIAFRSTEVAFRFTGK
ncbi:MAG: hypothetical protein AUG51_23670 [Acidobacteria bacterium 13_1_20CM_3_53_8]|nr:MAG: hypothetical protein AUG51_23670 [Acidobacteria bacterium 13_1_20CM_3_53_8]